MGTYDVDGHHSHRYASGATSRSPSATARPSRTTPMIMATNPCRGSNPASPTNALRIRRAVDRGVRQLHGDVGGERCADVVEAELERRAALQHEQEVADEVDRLTLDRDRNRRLE